MDLNITPEPLAATDVAKLHSEINQIHNQRFLLTTTAITVFGVFATLAPKEEKSQNLLSASAISLLFFLLLLHWWNRSLVKMQRILSSYLVARKASEWESTWKIFHVEHKNKWTGGRIETTIFFILGVASTIWHFGVAASLGINLPIWQKYWISGSGFTYLAIVLMLGIQNHLTNKNTGKKSLIDKWNDAIAAYRTSERGGGSGSDDRPSLQ